MVSFKTYNHQFQSWLTVLLPWFFKITPSLRSCFSVLLLISLPDWQLALWLHTSLGNSEPWEKPFSYPGNSPTPSLPGLSALPAVPQDELAVPVRGGLLLLCSGTHLLSFFFQDVSPCILSVLHCLFFTFHWLISVSVKSGYVIKPTNQQKLAGCFLSAPVPGEAVQGVAMGLSCVARCVGFPERDHHYMMVLHTLSILDNSH